MSNFIVKNPPVKKVLSAVTADERAQQAEKPAKKVVVFNQDQAPAAKGEIKAPRQEPKGPPKMSQAEKEAMALANFKARNKAAAEAKGIADQLEKAETKTAAQRLMKGKKG